MTGLIIYNKINTRVAFYIWGLEKKNINHRKSLYYLSKYSLLRCIHTFACVWAIVEALLPIWLSYLQKCILNTSTASSVAEKLWALILFFTYGNIKDSFGVRSELVSLGVIYDHDWMHHTIDKHWSLIGLHRRKFNLVHGCPVGKLVHAESCIK